MLLNNEWQLGRDGNYYRYWRATEYGRLRIYKKEIGDNFPAGYRQSYAFVDTREGKQMLRDFGL